VQANWIGCIVAIVAAIVAGAVVGAFCVWALTRVRHPDQLFRESGDSTGSRWKDQGLYLRCAGTAHLRGRRYGWAEVPDAMTGSRLRFVATFVVVIAANASARTAGRDLSMINSNTFAPEKRLLLNVISRLGPVRTITVPDASQQITICYEDTAADRPSLPDRRPRHGSKQRRDASIDSRRVPEIRRMSRGARQHQGYP
jgi:hypothetical protein